LRIIDKLESMIPSRCNDFLHIFRELGCFASGVGELTRVLAGLVRPTIYAFRTAIRTSAASSLPTDGQRQNTKVSFSA
jgi:hypothetical protein